MTARLAIAAVLLAVLVAAAPAAATYPGRNGAIAYSQGIGSGDTQPERSSSSILLQRSRSAEPRVLVQCVHDEGGFQGDCTSTTGFYDLSFSPDGKLIAFDAGPSIGIVAAAGGPVRLLQAATSNDGDPSFSPDGKRIAFTGIDENGGTSIYVRQADGTGEAKPLIYDASEPAFSVRGVLAYVREGNVYVRLPKRGHRLWVTSGVSPDWSPDGKRLVLIRPLPRLTFFAPLGRMYTVRPNGRGLTRVGRAVEVADPVWSPDGRFIAYDGFDLGVHVKLVGTHKQAREWAPTQYGQEGSISSNDPTWQPLP